MAKREIKPTADRTNELRILIRGARHVLQQYWWDGLRGEWRDVPIMWETYPLAHQSTNRGRLRK
jgi:hypothetical protein